ncbi:rod shape-determining protein MreD [Facklamia miroungae]|uniref:Rod shape-determining protein MreD n=1 Tax=Facklamia miroungae TaxID=120956 RepID=A0A1G7TXC6_9LACT|nr:rod shape-determining protein MreD [Facklamia miroungae]NKZ29994.1 rod shape-determining protein MreD [Facklamia miroungae]SDG39409.1 rod shape-determining protein MreD [Facklamia miroungae]
MNSFSTKFGYQRERNIVGIVPLVLLFALVIDSALPSIFPKAFLGNQQIIVSHLLIYFIVTFAFYLKNSSILIYAFIIGLIADAYNSTILGLYAILYFLMAYCIISVRKHFPRNAIIHMMLFIVSLTFIDFIVYFFYQQVGLSQLLFEDYVLMRLGPTLIFNTALTFFMYFPNRMLVRWLGYDDHIIF